MFTTFASYTFQNNFIGPSVGNLCSSLTVISLTCEYHKPLGWWKLASSLFLIPLFLSTLPLSRIIFSWFHNLFLVSYPYPGCKFDELFEGCMFEGINQTPSLPIGNFTTLSSRPTNWPLSQHFLPICKLCVINSLTGQLSCTTFFMWEPYTKILNLSWPIAKIMHQTFWLINIWGSKFEDFQNVQLIISWMPPHCNRRIGLYIWSFDAWKNITFTFF